MKIQYVSVHSVLEWEEVSLFTEMGHQVFSNGAYLNPAGHSTLPRPAIPNAPYYPQYEELCRKYPTTNMPPELIDPFDLVIVMHTPEVIVGNWEKWKQKGKKVVWRSIGQSTPRTEKIISFYKQDGLKVVRYSPKERFLKDYAGEDALIRFYKNENELRDWNGEQNKVINLTQSLKGRRNFCHYDQIMQMLDGFPSTVYGPGNTDLGSLNGGDISYDTMKQQLRDARVFVYGGSWPACYTLSFMEAFMTGIPVVAIGKRLAEEIPGVEYLNFYEVSDFIQDGVNGFCKDSVEELRKDIQKLLDNKDIAKRIGQAGREKAIELFGKQKIRRQWEEFFNSLGVT